MATEPTQEQIESQVAAIVDGGASSYAIGSRSVTKLDPVKLYKLAQEIAFDNDRQLNGAFRLAKIGRRR